MRPRSSRRRAFLARPCLALALLSPGAAAAQQATSEPVEGTFVAQTVDDVAAAVEREYFDPQRGAGIASTLRERRTAGHYDGLRTLEALVRALNDDLLAASGDKHLAVSVARHAGPGPRPTGDDGGRAVFGRRANFGVHQIEILAGNVGYLDLTAFFRPEEARDTLVAALRILRNADALILDLRHNGGGSPGTVALVASNLLDEPRLPLFEVVSRSGEKQTYATEPAGAVERDGRRPVVLLTAARTFSAGEGLAFLLQERRRAEVVGEPTAGAANPGRPYPVNERLEVTVPNGQVRSLLSGRNWEGTGVVPDVAVPAADALRVGHARALRALLARTPDAAWAESLRQALAALGG